jgi:4-amino-4-deoxy-L-arabinose transferase-like glycosyltransferase
VVVGSPTAELTGFFWLTLPVVVNRGRIASQQLLAVLFILTAILAWIKAVQKDRPSKCWTTLGVIAAGLGVLSSWEAVLLAPGLWVATILNRRKHVSLAVAYTLSIGMSLSAVVWLYAMAAPQLFVDAIQTAKFRMGLSPAYSHLIVHHSSEGPLSLTDTMVLEFLNHFFMLGIFGLAALIMFAVGGAKRFPKRSEDSVTVMCGMAAPWILWCVLMRDHVAVHDFEVLTAAPLASLALAIMATSSLRQNSGRVRPWIAGIALVAFVSLPLALCTLAGLNTDKKAGQLIEAAGVIERSTEVGAVILWSGDSMLPVYYSHRHVVRLVSNSQVAGELLPELRRAFPNAPFYIAMPREIEGRFAEILKNRIADTQEIVVFRVR